MSTFVVSKAGWSESTAAHHSMAFALLTSTTITRWSSRDLLTVEAATRRRTSTRTRTTRKRRRRRRRRTRTRTRTRRRRRRRNKQWKQEHQPLNSDTSNHTSNNAHSHHTHYHNHQSSSSPSMITRNNHKPKCFLCQDWLWPLASDDFMTLHFDWQTARCDWHCTVATASAWKQEHIYKVTKTKKQRNKEIPCSTGMRTVRSLSVWVNECVGRSYPFPELMAGADAEDMRRNNKENGIEKKKKENKLFLFFLLTLQNCELWIYDGACGRVVKGEGLKIPSVRFVGSIPTAPTFFLEKRNTLKLVSYIFFFCRVLFLVFLARNFLFNDSWMEINQENSRIQILKIDF